MEINHTNYSTILKSLTNLPEVHLAFQQQQSQYIIFPETSDKTLSSNVVIKANDVFKVCYYHQEQTFLDSFWNWAHQTEAHTHFKNQEIA